MSFTQAMEGPDKAGVVFHAPEVCDHSDDKVLGQEPEIFPFPPETRLEGEPGDIHPVEDGLYLSGMGGKPASKGVGNPLRHADHGVGAAHERVEERLVHPCYALHLGDGVLRIDETTPGEHLSGQVAVEEAHVVVGIRHVYLVVPYHLRKMEGGSEVDSRSFPDVEHPVAHLAERLVEGARYKIGDIDPEGEAVDMARQIQHNPLRPAEICLDHDKEEVDFISRGYLMAHHTHILPKARSLPSVLNRSTGHPSLCEEQNRVPR